MMLALIPESRKLLSSYLAINPAHVESVQHRTNIYDAPIEGTIIRMVTGRSFTTEIDRDEVIGLINAAFVDRYGA